MPSTSIRRGNGATPNNERKPLETPDLLKEEGNLRDRDNFWQFAATYGVIAGVLMGLFLGLLQGINYDKSIAMKFVKYIFLIVLIGLGIKRYMKYLTPTTVFQNGIKMGAAITLIAAIVLSLANIAIYSIFGPGSVDKFTYSANTMGDALVLEGVTFFEVLVFGMIITFCWVQGLKAPDEGKDGTETITS